MVKTKKEKLALLTNHCSGAFQLYSLNLYRREARSSNAVEFSYRGFAIHCEWSMWNVQAIDWTAKLAIIVNNVSSNRDKIDI